MSRSLIPTAVFIAGGILAVFGLAGKAQAAVVGGDIISLDHTAASAGFSGGAFTVTDYGQGPVLPGPLPPGPGVLQAAVTFCLERTETIYLGASNLYTVTDVTSTVAVRGGANFGGNYGKDGTPAPDLNVFAADKISYGTAVLYGRYLAGLGFAPATNAGYTALSSSVAGFSATNSDWDRAFQYTIWRLEDEVDNNYSGLLSGLDATSVSVLAKANALWNYVTGISGWQSDNAGNGFVRVMNLEGEGPIDHAKFAQSQLWYNDGPNNGDSPVPEPTTLAIWGGLGLAGLALQRMRRNKTVVA